MDQEKKLNELIAIVTRDVPKDLPNCIANPDCKMACLQAIARVSTHDKINATCLHEAGHFAESVKLGLMVGFKEEDIGYHAPRVIYCPEKFGAERFEPNPGAIQTPFDAKKVTWKLPILQQAARVAVAGGVYAHVFADRPIDEGTGGDCELYKNYYRIAHKKLHADPNLLIATKLWIWAIKEVWRDLKKHPKLAEEARKKAFQFTHEHYRPFLEFCDLNHL
jgi:hypothetical protein